jgi:hypothetical protein
MKTQQCVHFVLLTHKFVNNINTEHIAMDIQRCILCSIVVELKTFHNNRKHMGLHVKCQTFLSNFNHIWIFLIDLKKKVSNIKFHENLSSVSQFDTCRQTDGQTDMTKLIGTLHE